MDHPPGGPSLSAAPAAAWSAELLRAVDAISPFGLLVVDQEAQNVLYCNRRLLELWSAQDLLAGLGEQALRLADITGRCRRLLAEEVDPFASCGAGGACGERELTLRDGRLLRHLCVPMQPGAGVPAVLHLFEDVSARSRSQQRLQAYFDGARDAIITADVESGRIIEANREAERLLGRSREQILCLHQADLHPPEMRAQYVDQFRRYLGGTPSGVQAWLIRADGERVLCEINASVVELEDGRRALQGIFRDITERQRSVDALQQSEQRYRALFENARDAIFIADARSGRLMDVNRAAEQLLKRPRREIVGLHQKEIHAPAQRERAAQVFANHARGHREPIFEGAVQAADGEIVPVEISASRLTLADDQLAVLGTFRDLRPRQQAERAEEERNQFYRQMFLNNRAVKLLIDPADGRIVDANSAAAEFYGYELERLRAMCIQDINVLPPEELAERMHRAHTGERLSYQFRHRLASGELRDVEVFTGPVTVGGKEYLHSIIQDITERRRQITLQAARSRILELIARDQPLEDTLRELTRFAEAQLPGAHAVILLEHAAALVPVELHHLPASLRQALSGGSLAVPSSTGAQLRAAVSGQPMEGWTPRLLGEAGIHAEWSQPLLDKHDALLGFMEFYFEEPRAPAAADQALLQELARLAAVALEQRQLADALIYQAQHDSLTGLPNQALLRDRLEQALLHAQRLGTTVAVMLLDLDDFKLVNDSLGHTAGDHLLQAVSDRLTTCVRPDDTVARLGGDEFVLIMQLARHEHAGIVAQKVLQALAASYRVFERELHIMPSIGISLYPQDGASAEALLQAADTAMYAAKYAGKHRYHYYSESMNLQVTERFTLEGELRQALAEDQFELYYQPRFALGSGEILGAEALLRWRHPERGLLGPAIFLGVAEQSYLMNEIDAWVFRAASRQALAWQQAGRKLLLSVNLSAGQLHAEGFARSLVAAMQDAGLDPARLELEITESMLMKDIDRAIDQLEELKRLAPGLKVAIDDFGSGYSSLNYLRRLPIDTLKIDRAFVADLGHDEQSGSALAIVKTIIDLGHNLRLNVLAEGVETAEQAAILAGLGCQEGQGFWFARPLPLAHFEARLND